MTRTEECRGVTLERRDVRVGDSRVVALYRRLGATSTGPWYTNRHSAYARPDVAGSPPEDTDTAWAAISRYGEWHGGDVVWVVSVTPEDAVAETYAYWATQPDGADIEDDLEIVLVWGSELAHAEWAIAAHVK